MISVSRRQKWIDSLSNVLSGDWVSPLYAPEILIEERLCRIV